MKPRYPVYVISKGRADICLTANFLAKENANFHLVVEPQEADKYIERYGKERVYILPFSNLGLGGIPARNWVWENAKKAGYKRHWILDDNIRSIQRRYKAQKFKCDSGPAFAAIEDFVERYENIAIAGMNYSMFCPDRKKIPPFTLNHHVYSCLLILNELPHRWRGRYNEDTDLCLQVLADNWCTVLMNVFSIEKKTTMKMKGGNSDQLYKGDGRLKMARALERVWPYVTFVDRRFQRPQHKVRGEWRHFDTQLIRRTDIAWANLPNANNYGLELKQVSSEIKSDFLKNLVKTENRKNSVILRKKKT
jgi:hypothetical protein